MSIITTSHLRELKDFRFVDARSGADARQRYADGHLPGAVFADLDKDLADIKENAANGGRHPLPPVGRFTEWLGKAGIGPETTVVVYDDKGGANAAARFWWMLRALGHEKVEVVSGGMQALLADGWQLVADEARVPVLPPYPANSWTLPIATMDEVAKAASDPGRLVIDVREGYRYRGEKEPIDTVAGHIPGAANVPYIENMDAEGKFFPAGVLKEKYGNVLNNIKPFDVIVHCGSGVTACHTLLALDEAGIKGAKLYVGSWSEWSRNDNPIATGGQP